MNIKKLLTLLGLFLLLCQTGCTRVPQEKEYVVERTIEENWAEHYGIYALNHRKELLKVFGEKNSVLDSCIVEKVEEVVFYPDEDVLQVRVKWEDGLENSWFYKIGESLRSPIFPADIVYLGKELGQYTQENGQGEEETIVVNVFTGERQP